MPEITVDAANPTARVQQYGKQHLTFHSAGQSWPIELVPFDKVKRERYTV